VVVAFPSAPPAAGLFLAAAGGPVPALDGAASVGLESSGSVERRRRVGPSIPSHAFAFGSPSDTGLPMASKAGEGRRVERVRLGMPGPGVCHFDARSPGAAGVFFRTSAALGGDCAGPFAGRRRSESYSLARGGGRERAPAPDAVPAAVRDSGSTPLPSGHCDRVEGGRATSGPRLARACLGRVAGPTAERSRADRAGLLGACSHPDGGGGTEALVVRRLPVRVAAQDAKRIRWLTSLTN